jgi:hypothetical protein
LIIIDKAPCKISLNTHGGASIDVGFAVISSCLGKWAFRLQTDPVTRDGLYRNIASAYVSAMRAFNEQFKSVIPIPATAQNVEVDQW